MQVPREKFSLAFRHRQRFLTAWLYVSMLLWFFFLAAVVAVVCVFVSLFVSEILCFFVSLCVCLVV